MAVMLFNCLFNSFSSSFVAFRDIRNTHTHLLTHAHTQRCRWDEKLISYNYILKSEIEKKRRENIGPISVPPPLSRSFSVLHSQ